MRKPPFPWRKSFAATLGVSLLCLTNKAHAEVPVRLENSLTAGGVSIAPRYLDRNFDTDFSLLGGFINFPTIGGGSLLGFQTSLQTRLNDHVVLCGNLGSLTELGLRGPLWKQGGLSLGWDTHYRSESYYEISPGYGLNSSLLGMPGSMAAGFEAKLNAMQTWNGLYLFASPLVSVMSNRTFIGLTGGIDWPLDRWVLGYAANYHYNAVNPGAAFFKIAGSELQHSLGLRYTLNDRTFLQANYYNTPSDTYGVPTQNFLVGFGMRLLGKVLSPLPEAIAPLSRPQADPSTRFASVPFFSRPQVPAHFLEIRGRIYNSLRTGGNPQQPLFVGLKRKIGNKFIGIEGIYRTDANGNYVIRNFGGEGDYQVVFYNSKGLSNSVGVMVSDAVKVIEDKAAIVNMDIAWDDARFLEKCRDGIQTVCWSQKPSYKDTIFQGLVRGNPDNSKTDVLLFPAASTLDSKGMFKVSPQLKGRKIYYFIKFWKKGGAFNEANYYGQSMPRELKLP